MQKIAVIDYGMGNLRSVSKALEHVVDSNDTQIVVTSDQAVIAESDRVVCPGQGAAKDCMSQLREKGMDKAVINAVNDGKPFLGICMGLQVLLSESEENGGVECLDVLSGHVNRFNHAMRDEATGAALKIPHMGWSRVEQVKPHPLWNNIESGSRFYFCHSYFVKPANSEVVVGECAYGYSFSAVLAKDNIFACQFHPEKSARDGLQLLANFSRWNLAD